MIPNIILNWFQISRQASCCFLHVDACFPPLQTAYNTNVDLGQPLKLQSPPV